ncbi:MAG: response regulator transcription factor [bacterium]|nr:response regulator transcription factor [bacterium]
MMKIRALVIDDEVSNRGLITKYIKELNSNIEVVGEADNVRTGVDRIKELKPDLIFLDIKMPDGSGFALLDQFDEINFEIVFISGFDSYALKAFEFNALDYVLKPIDSVKFARTLLKVQSTIEKKLGPAHELRALYQSYDVTQLIITKIPVHIHNQVVLLAAEELIYLQAQDGCTLFKTIFNEKYLSSKQLSDFEFILENLPQLIRVSKGTYVNLNHVSSYSKGATCFLTMKDQTVIEISRRKKSDILTLLNGKKMI